MMRGLWGGRTVRSIETTARTRTEWFSVIWAAEQGRGNAASRCDVPGSVLSEQTFSAASDEAFIVWDSDVPSAGHADPITWFAGNEVRDPPPPVRIDVSALRTLSDEDFWPVIDSLQGRLWDRTLSVAAGLLAQAPEEFILRWAETAAVKALALADVLEAAGTEAHDEIHAIGAVIGKGQRAFDEVLSNADAFDPSWCTDNSAHVLTLASHAYERRTGMSADIHTAFQPRASDIQARVGAWVAEYQRQRDIEPHAPDPVFRAARAVVRTRGALRERIVLVSVHGRSGRSLDELARIEFAADGSEIVAGPEFAMQRAIGSWGGEAFAIKRRTTLNVPAYIQKYSTIPTAEA